ncbi:putative DNA-directed RNA polymerase II subunit RPB9 [Babesia bovis T2Bo]|uniref:DNA-directed RNA polymerase 2 subunit, putative n=1 Tax=Babesia bovis TaxID=5865 RepID=A7AUU3_BABBO|nr:putative DNA-directed RNA polymerase II subunit RPB9 [Babesia bovis T2Bo]EDO06704.1 putative DNA-directed RNA polymerase II subunit RPB9 [Babesia bovis T2Bo]|eukprot:XP_001610272.1 DNA-directed RNA polymerase 2 subunit [Babesia bovis T2Bo]
MSDLKFCPECNNILYARPDLTRRQLVFICRQCDYSRWADPGSLLDNCINRTTYNYQTREDIIIPPLITKDPTLGRTRQWDCPRCGHTEATFFQLPERAYDDAMVLVFVCCNPGCGFWTKQIDNMDNDRDGIEREKETIQPMEFEPIINEKVFEEEMAELFGED